MLLFVINCTVYVQLRANVRFSIRYYWAMSNFWVPLKDPWARIEPHGRELRRMGAHGGAWTRTTAKGHAVAGAGFKAETLRHWTGESKKLLRTTHVNMTRNGAAWRCHGRARRRMETYPAHGHELQRNAMNNCRAIAGRTARCRSASLYISDYEWCWCIVIYTCIIKIWLLFYFYIMTVTICA